MDGWGRRKNSRVSYLAGNAHRRVTDQLGVSSQYAESRETAADSPARHRCTPVTGGLTGCGWRKARQTNFAKGPNAISVAVGTTSELLERRKMWGSGRRAGPLFPQFYSIV